MNNLTDGTPVSRLASGVCLAGHTRSTPCSAPPSASASYRSGRPLHTPPARSLPDSALAARYTYKPLRRIRVPQSVQRYALPRCHNATHVAMRHTQTCPHGRLAPNVQKAGKGAIRLEPGAATHRDDDPLLRSAARGARRVARGASPSSSCGQRTASSRGSCRYPMFMSLPRVRASSDAAERVSGTGFLRRRS